MANAFSRSWALGKQSLSVLRQDKQLVLFPLVSAISCILVLASFAVPIILTLDWEALRSGDQAKQEVAQTPLTYVVLFAFYFVNYTVIAFFNAALIGCVMRRFDGQPAGLGDGIKIAMSRLPQILGWALVSATVGMILRAISERAGIIGKIIIGLIGFVWTIATYFVVPVLVVEGVGPIDAVKRSAATIKKTWGESLVANIGLGALNMVAGLVALIPLFAGIGGSIALDSPWPIAIGGGLTFFLLVALALIASTLQTILVAALYRFAATGQVPTQFDSELLSQAFREKKKKA